jgi:hypothetical protein
MEKWQNLMAFHVAKRVLMRISEPKNREINCSNQNGLPVSGTKSKRKGGL